MPPLYSSPLSSSLSSGTGAASASGVLLPRLMARRTPPLAQRTYSTVLIRTRSPPLRQRPQTVPIPPGYSGARTRLSTSTQNPKEIPLRRRMVTTPLARPHSQILSRIVIPFRASRRARSRTSFPFISSLLGRYRSVRTLHRKAQRPDPRVPCDPRWTSTSMVQLPSQNPCTRLLATMQSRHVLVSAIRT